MTEPTKIAIAFVLILGGGIAVIGYVGYLYPPYEKASSEAVSERTAEIAVDIGQNTAQATFDDLLDAIEWVESRGDANAVGDNGNAVGSFQIWKIYVDDVNRIMKLKEPVAIALVGDIFSYEDRWDKGKSNAMVGILTQYYAEKAWAEIWRSKQFKTSSEKEGFMKYFELMARIHNGGPNGWKKESTKPYWEKVKARLEI